MEFVPVRVFQSTSTLKNFKLLVVSSSFKTLIKYVFLLNFLHELLRVNAKKGNAKKIFLCVLMLCSSSLVRC